MTLRQRHKRLYHVWAGMKQRCGNPNHKSYQAYGAKGVRVCKRWSDSFSAFVFDMGIPTPGMTLDRIDSSANYEASNCRWASRAEQSRNRPSWCLFVVIDGKTVPLAEAWERRMDKRVSYEAFRKRVTLRGWSVERALAIGYRGMKSCAA